MISKQIINTFNNTPDLIYKSYNFKKTQIEILYLETVCSSDKVNDYILKGIVNAILNKTKINDIKNIIAIGSTKKLYNIKDIVMHIQNGFSIIIYDNTTIYAIETRADINRSIEKPSVEASIKGPQDSFSENYQVNIGLIKKRLKDTNLQIKTMIVGKRTKNQIGILYIKDICNEKNIKYIEEKLNKYEFDGITDSSELTNIIEDDNFTTFPTIIETERPDNVVTSLLEGKVAIIMDSSNNALIAPGFFTDFINPKSDKYTKSLNINFIKLLRLICFFISIISPSLYIAISNYNQETIPTKLLINFTVQRQNVPFPASIEIFIMLIVCEILRESDLRFPSVFGSAISILGALILGDAAVSAGIVSPIIIIVVALSFISSLMFSDINLINSIRRYRFLFLFLSSILGLYGFLISFIFLIINLVSIKSLDYSYTLPISPIDLNYLKEGLLSTSFKKNSKRSEYLAKKNLIKKVEK